MANAKPVDEHAAHELELYIENDSRLYNQKKSIIENIKKKMIAGNYDSKLAPKLWRYWVDSGATLYCKDYGMRLADTFTVATRDAVAKGLAEDYEKTIRNGEYGPVTPKKPTIKYTLARRRLDRQGYDDAGRYYGVGAPLFLAQNKENANCIEFRAADREAAKKKLDHAIEVFPTRVGDFNHYELKAFIEE